MSQHLTATTFLPWLAQEAQHLAQATSADGDPFPELWAVAVDALDWLRRASTEEQEEALQMIKQCLDTGAAGSVTVPPDGHQAKCLTTLLRWILHPPRVL